VSNKKITPEITWQEITPGGTVYEAGSAETFLTGDWRSEKPTWITSACKQCLLCAPVCPDTSIPVEASKREAFDYDHCKGCGVCGKVCPFGAITMGPEKVKGGEV